MTDHNLNILPDVHSKYKHVTQSNVIAGEVSTHTFTKILIAVIISWVLISLWTNVVDAYAYHYLGLDRTSVKHTLAIAVVGTILFLIFVNLCGDETKVIKSRMTGIVAQPAAEEDSVLG